MYGLFRFFKGNKFLFSSRKNNAFTGRFFVLFEVWYVNNYVMLNAITYTKI